MNGRAFIFAPLAVIMFAPVVRAQSAGTTPPGMGRNDPVQRELRQRLEAEALERALMSGPNRLPERYSRFVLKQIQEDFLRIQVISEGLVQENARSESDFDLKLVNTSASEIKRRAARLRSNLAFPNADDRPDVPKAKPATDVEQLRLTVSILDDLIVKFVSNPVFVDASVVDARLSAKASRDLRGIIELSDYLRKTSQRLKRLAEKSR